MAQGRRARIAVAAMFLTNGAIFANLVPRFPELKTDLALSNTSYGVVVAAFPVGALVAGLAAGAVVRSTSARTTLVCTIGIALLVFAAGLSTTPVLLALTLFAGGVCDSMTDVAQNAHGLRVQRVYGRSIINSLHAVWSVGAVIGAAMGAAAIALHVPISVHLGVSAAVFIGVAAAAYPFLLRGADHEDDPEADTQPPGRPGWRVYGALAALVVIAIAGAVVEDAGSSWATLYLRDSLGAPGAVAAFGYIALVGFMFIGRLIGDRMVDRFGERARGAGRRIRRRRRDGRRAGVSERARHDRGVRGRGAGCRDADTGGHARCRSAARHAPGHRADGGDVADAGRVLRRTVACRRHRRRDEPAQSGCSPFPSPVWW